MAKVVLAGDAVVVKSALKFEDIEKIAKYRPEALKLKDEDGAEYFFVAAEEGHNSIGKYGVVFGKKEADGIASLTTLVVGGEGDRKEIIADLYGEALINLKKVEEALPAVLAEVDAEKAAIIATITEG